MKFNIDKYKYLPKCVLKDFRKLMDRIRELEIEVMKLREKNDLSN